MAYANEAKILGNEPVAYIEIDLKACANVFGSAPCTATGSGDAKCFNGFATCKDKPNYTETVKTLRFSSVRIDALQASGDAPTFPSLVGLSVSPSVLTPGEGLGIRSTCNITLEDHPYTFVGIDPYFSTRTYDHAETGSLWTKLLSMFPYYENIEVRVFTGYLESDGTYNAANFQQRTYFIESITGPSEAGKVSIKGKDPLRFADNGKAQLPTQSNAILSEDIDGNDTQLNITDVNDDIFNAFSAPNSQAYIRIDDEVMLIQSISGSNPSYILSVTRGSLPSFYLGTSTPDSHEANATVQDCYLFNQADFSEITEYLLDDVAGIDPAYLPTSDWDDVVQYGLQNYSFSTLLTEPIGVKNLLEELMEHNLYLWWDERASEVKMDSIIRRTIEDDPYNDEEHILAQSVQVSRDDAARVSQVWFAFAHRNPTLEMDELKNFKSVIVSGDVDKESSLEYGQKKVKRIFSRWLPLDKRNIAGEIANRFLAYYKDTKTLVSFEMSGKDFESWTGDLIRLKTRLIQDAEGTNPNRIYRILESNEITSPGQMKYKYTAQSVGSFFAPVEVRFANIGPNSLSNYGSETEQNKLDYAFIATNTNGFSNGDRPYSIV